VEAGVEATVASCIIGSSERAGPSSDHARIQHGGEEEASVEASTGRIQSSGQQIYRGGEVEAGVEETAASGIAGFG
jgi:hypothetical protein